MYLNFNNLWVLLIVIGLLEFWHYSLAIPFGVQKGKAPRPGGTRCYFRPYSNRTTAADIQSCCNQYQYLLVAGFRNKSSTSFITGAYGFSCAVCSQMTPPVHESDGVYWYWTDKKAFGFAGIPTVTLAICDTNTTGSATFDRLCWHMTGTTGGFRVGNFRTLNSNSVFMKAIYGYNDEVAPSSCTTSPTMGPTLNPVTLAPTISGGTVAPSVSPTTAIPSLNPTAAPSVSPTVSLTFVPTTVPSQSPTYSPTLTPTDTPSSAPGSTNPPSASPTQAPTAAPSFVPSQAPTRSPTVSPTDTPSSAPGSTNPPSVSPTQAPTAAPSFAPSQAPTRSPTFTPSVAPTGQPIAPGSSQSPSFKPSTFRPTTFAPTVEAQVNGSSTVTDKNSSSKTSSRIMIAIIVGVIIAVIVLCSLLLFFVMRRRESKKVYVVSDSTK